jgi:hypothetical protein
VEGRDFYTRGQANESVNGENKKQLNFLATGPICALEIPIDSQV